jgi:hypothetical protein
MSFIGETLTNIGNSKLVIENNKKYIGVSVVYKDTHCINYLYVKPDPPPKSNTLVVYTVK